MVILVTGASRGIGKEIARKMAEKGNSVIANYNKSEKEAEKLQKENDNIEIYKADVSNRTEVHEMIQNILKKYGKIDVMINNAGISEEKMFIDVTDEDWNKVINTNLYSVFCAIQEALPNMISRINDADYSINKQRLGA